MVGEDFGFVLFISSMVGLEMDVLPSSERENGENLLHMVLISRNDFHVTSDFDYLNLLDVDVMKI